MGELLERAAVLGFPFAAAAGSLPAFCPDAVEVGGATGGLALARSGELLGVPGGVPWPLVARMFGQGTA